MADTFDNVLDICLDRIRAGEDPQSILTDYPAQAEQLRPLLMAAAQTAGAYSFTPSADAKLASKKRFDAALLAQRENRRVHQPWFRRPLAWGAVATAVVAILIVFVGVRPALSPSAPVVLPIVPVASPSGNFAFLISDDVNAIANFDNVTVDISKIGIQQASDGKWIEIAPITTQVDLKTVPGDLTKEIWRGDIPTGDYSQVFVYVDSVNGILTATQQATEIKLPSQKLHLKLAFSVSETDLTSFTYDMTVFQTGNGKNSKYILKPQAGESGATQSDAPGQQDKDKPEKPAAPDQRPTDQRAADLPPAASKNPKK